MKKPNIKKLTPDEHERFTRWYPKLQSLDIYKALVEGEWLSGFLSEEQAINALKTK